MFMSPLEICHSQECQDPMVFSASFQPSVKQQNFIILEDENEVVKSIPPYWKFISPHAKLNIFEILPQDIEFLI